MSEEQMVDELAVNMVRMELLSDTPDTRSTTVRAAGEIDVSNVVAFQDGLEVACELGRRVIVDLEGVTFIDSTGISVLVRVANQAGVQHRGLVIQNPSSSVRKIISVLGLDEMLGFNGP
jgi:anti-anti-sigma factor